MRNLMFAGLAAAALLSAAGASSAQPVVVERYGHWDPAWGAMPPAPSHHWRPWHEHEGEWCEHVHTCMTRCDGYEAHRDMYREGHRRVACAD